MAKKTYCPIMIIGFDVPKQNAKYDPRVCKKDCRWYNELEEDCNINVIADNISLFTEFIEWQMAQSYGELE